MACLFHKSYEFACLVICMVHAKANLYTKIDIMQEGLDLQWFLNIHHTAPATMEYSESWNDLSLLKCGVKCVSYPGCKFFHHDGQSCYILNMVTKGVGTINVTTLFVDEELEEHCNIVSSYRSFMGGLFCLGVYYSSVNWTTAQAKCGEDGGQLLTLNQVEFSLKMETVKLHTGLGYWIGSNDVNDGQITWVDGSVTAVNNWAPGEPNNSTGGLDGCVYLNGNWTQTVLQSSITKPFICELPFLFQL